MKPYILLFSIDLMLAAFAACVITSCSTPGSGPTPGQQAVLASAAHRTSQSEIQDQVMFMRNFQAMQAQGRAR